MKEFEYSIDIEGVSYTVKPLDSKTIDAVISLVEENSINSSNFRKLFGEEGEPEFEKSGALLETSVEELHAVMTYRNSYLSVVLEDSNNTVVGFLNTQLEDVDGFSSLIDKLSFNEGFDSKTDEWKEEINGGRMAYKGNYVLDKTSVYSGIFYVLVHILCKELIKLGKKRIIEDIFAITGYKYKDNTRNLDLFNKRSFISQVFGLEACYVADGPKSIIKKGDGLEIEYYTKFLELDLIKAYEICNRVLFERNITVQKVA